MSSLPPDSAGASRSGARAQVLLDSPLAAAPRMLGYQAWRRPAPPMAWRRVIGWTGSLLAQLVFLFAFVLGPAYEPPPVREAPAAKMQLRFVEVPDAPPPKGEVPRKLGPVHRAGSATPPSVQRATAATHQVRVEAPPASKPAAPEPAPSLPQAAPDLQPVQAAVQTPPVALPVPVVQPPAPPKFQPRPLRAPQVEGNEPIPPPPSLALPSVPTPAAPVMAMPTPALDRVAPPAPRPTLAPAMALSLPPAADEALQAVPVAAPVAPTVNLDATRLHAPTVPAPQRLAKMQAPKVDAPAEEPLAAIPQPPLAPPVAAPAAQAAVKLHTPAAPAQLGQLAPVAVAPAAAGAATPASQAKAGDAGESAQDVSSAPNASASGSDTVTPGVPQGSTQATAAEHHGSAPTPGSGQAKGLIAPPGTPAQTGAAGNEPDYVQLKPTGNTTIMEHKIKGIDYKPTRFDPYWTPEGESSVDTALRRAAEKTTIKHTFHLPRGIRIECAVMPLVPVALLGCHNPDTPPPPQPQKLYDRLNQPSPKGGAVPQVAAPASAPAQAAPVRLGNAALCAAARVSGGPLPPDCPPAEAPSTMKPVHPAPASSSWVPASDQFH